MFVLYVAGPMAFRADSDFNYPAFEEATQKLRAAGFIVVSPHEVDPDNVPGSRHYLWYVRQTLKQLLECQGVAVLPGIHFSSGALQECSIALHLKMPIMTVDAWLEYGPVRSAEIQLVSWDSRRIVEAATSP